MAYPEQFTHYVFVDFENVPTVDLAEIGGKTVHVTLLVGKQQKHLNVSLVRQALQHPQQIALIEAGVSGHNALDLVLAAYLGRASLEHPEAEFTVVSRDKGFDALIAHLRPNGVRVKRDPDFFTRAEKTHRTVPATETHVATPRRTARPKTREDASVPADKLEKITNWLTVGTTPLPRTESRLLHLLSDQFANKLNEAQVRTVLDDFIRRGLVAIGVNGTVTYPKRPHARSGSKAHRAEAGSEGM